ncbi:NAD(P)-dependent oxidoreductase [Halopseudomonas pelagia]|uniref:dTDP-4-dehydrorhamnose reductase n=2 Tax=Halopseudomonas pelagia TaxID=553151 RepID=A0AA91Z565_9GAMM|nr:dTDP-4-dehydrorhamnose reductase [Halopseudomonas pelagia]QFY55560.1 NAD(P)-dependent oxidoreductase [Halopseudomonas pelagia]
MRMRILLLGADSLMGQAVLRLAAAEEIAIDAVERPEQGWKAEQLKHWFTEYQPDAVVNLAFYHQHFQLGSNDGDNLALQRKFGKELIALSKQADSLLFLLSSARVFDGLKTTAYTEKDALAPGDALGQLHVDMEKQLKDHCARHIMLRLGWVLDGSPDGQLAGLLQQLRSGEPMLLAEEWRGNPTPVNDAARVVLAILKQLDCDAPLYGTYHYGSSEASSWISFVKSLAQELLATKQLDSVPTIRSVPFDQQLDSAWEPQNAVLSSRRLLMAFGIKPRAWRAQLPELLASVPPNSKAE